MYKDVKDHGKPFFSSVVFVTDDFSPGKNSFASSINVIEDITEASQSVIKNKFRSRFPNKKHAAFIKKD